MIGILNINGERNMNRRDKQLQDELIEKAKAQTTNMAVNVMLSATMVMLKKEFGFGQQRLERAMLSLEKEIEPIGQGMIGWKDFRSYAEEFTGVNLSGENNY